ncbi:hypothetical protein SDC9_41271 [bioreactor metagenome]|uniref:Cyanobacterial TRADD-N associated 2 transmembrane domain-containing protein n=1 Tax=bioreactor metagenome TaxID=1076179 RepID=A0A644VV10_9ZZZZ|nr:hypothetical protein [Paludibacter sp.]
MEQILINDNSEEIAREVSVLKTKKEQIQQQFETFKFVWWGWVISSVIGAGIAFIFFTGSSYNGFNISRVISNLLAGALIGAFFYAYIFGAFRFLLSNRLRKVELELVKTGAVELQESIDQNFFTKLVQINFKYIDQYYLQTQEQADKSFRVALFAAISGFLIVISGVIMMYYGKTEPAYVTTASGIISEFIAAVFFYLYNRTILKMSQYHQKLVLTQNISLALKITDEMEKEQKDKALQLLVERLTLDINKYLSDSEK